jgi:hypothetical protein
MTSATLMSTRSKSASAAPLDATERNALTSMLAPSKTSGHQKWNGTAETLKPIPTINPNSAMVISAAEVVLPAAAPVTTFCAMVTMSRLPYRP